MREAFSFFFFLRKRSTSR